MEDQDNNEKIKLHTHDYFLIFTEQSYILCYEKQSNLSTGVLFCVCGLVQIHFSILIATSVINRSDTDNVPAKRKKKTLQGKQFCITQLL